MLKNKTSLIIVCVFIGILICHFTMCGCKTNYSLIEGMTGATSTATQAPASTGNALSDAITTAKAMTGSTATTASAPASAPTPAPAPAPATAANTTSGSAKSKGPANASNSSTTATTATPATSATTTATPAVTATTAGKESFQQQGRPLEYGSLQESKSDDWNFSKWVKDATRYAKGMGNENRLDSYQYNSGPKIPLPEGEMNFFKDTKFSPSCCPSSYSSSLGCACLSKPQVNYLTTRGGNNNIPAGCKNSGCKASYINEY